MIIKNKAELATTEPRRLVLEIIEAGIAQVLPSALMSAAVEHDGKTLRAGGLSFKTSQGRVFVIGGGKAAGAMAEALERIMGPDAITAGVVTCNSIWKTRKVEVMEAGHPIPDSRGVAGVERMMGLKRRYRIGQGDLVICLISGGGSALMPLPAEGMSLRDKQRVTDLLLCCGAEIQEVNAVRKHLSGVKGGRLGAFFSPATVLSLVLSDVVGDDLSTIASGPTCPDPSTFKDAYGVLERHGIVDRVPAGVKAHLVRGMEGKAEETPKSLGNCHSVIIGSNRLALSAMEAKGKELGLHPIIVTGRQRGETGAAARLRAGEAPGWRRAGHDLVLLGGETAPRLPRHAGRGGRNQHYAAVSLLEMEGYPGEWVVASAGTDGSDFIPGVAGAIVDNGSLARARASGLDVASFIERCDSNTLFRRLGASLINTGSTATNVGDLIVYLLRSPSKPRTDGTGP